MPRLKDSRKQKNSIFNGWVDDNESSSPLADLLSKVVPLMRSFKRAGAIHLPPPPPFDGLPVPATVCLSIAVAPTVASDGFLSTSAGDAPVTTSYSRSKHERDDAVTSNIEWQRPELSDYSCSQRRFVPVEPTVVADLVTTVRHRFESDRLQPEPPLLIEDSDHFAAVVEANSTRLLAVYFFANWCNPCKSLTGVFRQLALKIPTVKFLKVRQSQCLMSCMIT